MLVLAAAALDEARLFVGRGGDESGGIIDQGVRVLRRRRAAFVLVGTWPREQARRWVLGCEEARKRVRVRGKVSPFPQHASWIENVQTREVREKENLSIIATDLPQIYSAASFPRRDSARTRSRTRRHVHTRSEGPKSINSLEVGSNLARA